MRSREAVDIWTIDKATIWAKISQRNALRRSALLPLLDEQQELERGCRLIRDKRWYAFNKGKQAVIERFRDEVYAERGTPSGTMGRWAWHIEIDRRVEAFLRANYADEIATIMDITPDYLAITRQTVEGASHDQPANLRRERIDWRFRPVGRPSGIRRSVAGQMETPTLPRHHALLQTGHQRPGTTHPRATRQPSAQSLAVQLSGQSPLRVDPVLLGSFIQPNPNLPTFASASYSARMAADHVGQVGQWVRPPHPHSGPRAPYLRDREAAELRMMMPPSHEGLAGFGQNDPRRGPCADAGAWMAGIARFSGFGGI
jgi:hypothetical protein